MAALSAGGVRPASGGAQTPSSIERLCRPEAALILHGFDCGSDAFEDWLGQRRAEHQRLVVRALARGAEQVLAIGQPALANEAAAALVRLDPLSDTGHALRLAAHGRLGDAAGVEAAYFACAELLRDELGIRPSAGIEAAYAEARAAPGRRTIRGRSRRRSWITSPARSSCCCRAPTT